MKNTLIVKLNIIKLVLIFSAGVFIYLNLPISALAKEINSENIIELINESRLENNLFPLIENPILSKVAQAKAIDMTKNHYFSHTSPEGITPWYWFEKNNYFYKYAGENLAINYDSAEEEHRAWMESLAHKKNILNYNFNEIGIATSRGIIDGKKSYVTVTVFGTPTENILAISKKSPTMSKNSYILGVQSDKTKNTLSITEKNSFYQLTAENKIFKLVQKQSNNIIWTVALVAILIVLKDIVLKTIQTKSFHHKHSAVNLILFIMLYTILF